MVKLVKDYKFKGYDRKIKVKCFTCGYVYTKWADKMLNYTVDGTECNCKPNFYILKELKGINKK